MRLGTDWGVTVNQRVLKRVTVEAIGQSSLQRDEFVLTGLGKHHFPIISRRFNIYFGGGLHKGWNSDPEIQDPWGMDLVGGIEFTAARVNISYDFKPAFNFAGGEKSFYSQTGISLRYVMFKKRKYPYEKKNKKGKDDGEGGDWKFWNDWGDKDKVEEKNKDKKKKKKN